MCVDDVFWEPRDCVFMYSLKNFVDDFFFHVLKSIENTPKIGKEVKGTKGTSNSRRLLLPIYLFIFPTYIRERGKERTEETNGNQRFGIGLKRPFINARGSTAA